MPYFCKISVTFELEWTFDHQLPSQNGFMDEMCGLKFQLSCVDMPQDCEILPCHVIFIIEFVILTSFQ